MVPIEYIQVKDEFEIAALKEKEVAGLEQIGAGSFASVFSRPDLEYVVKYNRHGMSDDGYFCYLKAMVEDGKFRRQYWEEQIVNPFLPVLYKIQVFMRDSIYMGYVVRMEKLLGYSDVESTLKFERDIKEICDHIYDAAIGHYSNTSSFYDGEALKNLLKILHRASSENNNPGSYDLHNNNWMMRGNQIVLTDPLA
jgi:hypothetical protein